MNITGCTWDIGHPKVKAYKTRKIETILKHNKIVRRYEELQKEVKQKGFKLEEIKDSYYLRILSEEFKIVHIKSLKNILKIGYTEI